MVFSNEIYPARWTKTTIKKNSHTTNHFISEAIHQRQRDEYDQGVLEVCREPLLGGNIPSNGGDEREVSMVDTNKNSN